MRKFIVRTALFIVPFVAAYITNISCYEQDQGDLARLGYLYHNPSPKKSMCAKFALKKQYTLVSEINLTHKTKFEVFTIGDSFSDQDSLGYNNYLANNGTSVLNMDRFLAGNNPLQTLIGLVNGGFFDCVDVNYVVLQSVERDFVQRCQNLNYDASIGRDSIIDKIGEHVLRKTNCEIGFFSIETIKIPLTNILYNYTPNPLNSKTYKVGTNTNKLFSQEPGDLLFYYRDIIALEHNNNIEKINEANEEINKISRKLSEKGIVLILLISPDKFDIYHKYIKESYCFEKPLFFGVFNKMPKDYIWVNTKGVLQQNIEQQKDIYYYDDTHWSPIGAQIIANEIERTIKRNK